MVPARFGIRVALAEVRGISAVEVGRIVAGQPYRSLDDFWRRARVSRPVAERLARVGAFDSLYRGRRMGRRDLLCQVGALARADRYGAVGPGQLGLELAEEIPPGELPEMTLPEVIEAELEILGMDVSRHVLSCYDDLLNALGVVRSRDLPNKRANSQVLVAGVKIATQTPAVRSGQRVIFATVDDATGPVDATFFESVQDRCAATVFGSWLLVIQGRLRRTGGLAVSLNATSCWDLTRLREAWLAGGLDAVRAAMAAAQRPPAPRTAVSPIIYANGFRLSPYADITPTDGAVKNPPRELGIA